MHANLIGLVTFNSHSSSCRAGTGVVLVVVVVVVVACVVVMPNSLRARSISA